MKPFILFCMVLVLFSTIGYSIKVENADRPAKGIWDFKQNLEWRIGGYNGEPIVNIKKIVLADNGSVLLFDTKHFKFFLFNKKGKLIRSFGKRGEGPGEIKNVFNFYLINKRIIVWGMGKTHYFDLDGKFEKSVPFKNTTLLGVSPLQFIDEKRYVKSRFVDKRLGNANKALELIDIESDKIIYLDGEEPVKPKDGKKSGGVTFVSGGNGNMETKTGYVTSASGGEVCWGRNSSYIIHQCNNKGVEIMNFSIPKRKRRKISQAYKDEMVQKFMERLSAVRFSGSGPSKEDYKKRFIKKLPGKHTFFKEIAIDKRGNIYVLVSHGNSDNGQEIDIYSTEGKYMYRGNIKIPEGKTIKSNGIVFKGNFFYMVLEDEAGEITLSKFKYSVPVLK